MAQLNRDATVVDVGPGLLYIADASTPDPTGLDPSAWPSQWIELGYTDQGSEFQIDPNSDDVNVAEETDPVRTIVGTATSTLQMSLAQITAFNMAVAFGGGTIDTPTGMVTFEPPDAGTATVFKIAWASTAGDEAMVWRRCQPNGAIDMQRQAGNNKALIPVTFSVLAVGGGVKPWMWMGSTSRQGPDASLVGVA